MRSVLETCRSAAATDRFPEHHVVFVISASHAHLFHKTTTNCSAIPLTTWCSGDTILHLGSAPSLSATRGAHFHIRELCGQGRVIHAVNARIDRSMHESALRIERAVGACCRPFGFGKLSRVRTNVAARSSTADAAASSSSAANGAPPSTSTAIVRPRGVPHHRRRT